MSNIKSPLRYPGGKSRAIKKILPHFPEKIQDYREPFIGGGSLFFVIQQQQRLALKTTWINDLNHDLYCFWLYAQQDMPKLVTAVKTIKETYHDGRQLFAELTQPEKTLSEFERAVRFFVLNRITFSGTVESGGYSQQAFEQRFTESSIQRLQQISPFLTEVKITNLDYQAIINAPGDEVFVFLDPPYWKATKSKLYGKKGDLHTTFDHEQFAQMMEACPHRWLITYDDSPKIRDLFGFAKIVEWDLQYGMNNYRQGRAAKGQELMIKNYN